MLLMPLPSDAATGDGAAGAFPPAASPSAGDVLPTTPDIAPAAPATLT
eukprot:CAMPEP_0195148066 /NCGR_PEP_ID=MMETSP0448-20130528/174554_1 /TAXON_ID=66468 /ORGANISM="Heterocapsa triquestra, Strain CCMP 448" /LENGTH=47 /DNA_ID= /DNA_START= /DNA_END= /DNA_ORIENTATION=